MWLYYYYYQSTLPGLFVGGALLVSKRLYGLQRQRLSLQALSVWHAGGFCTMLKGWVGWVDGPLLLRISMAGAAGL